MTIRTRPVTQEYAEGWERTFGEKSERVKRNRKFRREMAAKVREMNERPNPYLRRLA